MVDFSDEWKLTGSASADIELDFVEPTFAAEFPVLGTSAADLQSEIQATSGLTLRLSADGRFTQAVDGKPDVMWFDVEGVLEDHVDPFDGVCHEIDGRLYLIADDRPRWATSKEEIKQQYYRYDDSDTVICDFVELKDDRLLRTVNVLTDGRYKNVILMVYERA